MSENTIKSGDELVAEFLISIADNANVDAKTLSSIVTLRDEKKLSKNRLLKSLQIDRAGDNTNDEDKNS